MDRKIYRCFKDKGDGEIWAKYDGNQIYELLRHNYSISEPVKNYMERQFNIAKTILWDANRIYVNVKNAEIPKGFYFSDDPKKYTIESRDKPSPKDVTIKIFRHLDEGRGWAIFLEKTKEKVLLLSEDHWDNVLDFLIEGYIQKKNIDFDISYLDQQIDNFILRPEHFFK